MTHPLGANLAKLDTGRLFPQAHALWRKIVERREAAQSLDGGGI